MPLFEPCQFFNKIGEHPFSRALRYEVRGHMGVRTVLRRYFGRSRVGTSSLYAEGQWVQVLDKESVQKTLNAESKLRGLLFLPYMSAYCGGAYRVQRVMRGMIDDEGVFRPVSRTILLEGANCSDDPAGGCGRGCPLMFRDEWVKPASAPARPDRAAGKGRWVRVRSAQKIQASLDKAGKRDGLLFMPEMYRWADGRFRLARQVERVFEYEAHANPPRKIYNLQGLHCSGAVLGRRGLCDRSCSILWHEDWLHLDDEREAAP